MGWRSRFPSFSIFRLILSFVTGVFKLSSSLDSSLKKNTTFIKRLRTSLNADNQSALLKDIAGLSLEKYIPEVVGAASEGLQKCKSVSDILAAVEVPATTCAED